MINSRTSQKICWALTDGKAGMVSQVMGLSHELGLLTVQKTCVRSKLWALLPVKWTQYFKGLKSCGDDLKAPWPDVLIASGRRSIPLALYVRRQSQGKTFVIYTQDPRIDSKHFDMVIAMDHDRITGDNVHKVSMAMNHVTQEKLQAGAAAYKQKFEHYPAPFCAVMIGGSTHRYTMDDEAMDRLIFDLEKMLETFKGTLLITPSRRTNEGHIQKLRQRFEGNTRVFVADLKQDNPYFGFLGLAEFFLVTDDSVNMISECCATGKTVCVYDLKKHQSTKAKRFAQKLMHQKKVFQFEGRLDHRQTTYENETQKMAKLIRQKLIKERGFSLSDFKVTE